MFPYNANPNPNPNPISNSNPNPKYTIVHQRKYDTMMSFAHALASIQL